MHAVLLPGLARYDRLVTAAAYEGRLAPLQFFILELRCSWTPAVDSRSVLTIAASYGHLQLVQWAWENGCPEGELSAKAAADGGHLEVLSWLLDNGCAGDRQALVMQASVARARAAERRRWLGV
jgi:hypothetical protein